MDLCSLTNPRTDGDTISSGSTGSEEVLVVKAPRRTIVSHLPDAIDDDEAALSRTVGGSEDNAEAECFFCGTSRNLTLCGLCGDVYYCSQDCFEVHRPEEKCFPFIVKKSPTLGR